MNHQIGNHQNANMWIAIGSRAAKKSFGHFYREVSNSDLDIYTTKKEFTEWFNNNPKNLEKCFPLSSNKFRIKIKDTPIIELSLYDNSIIYEYLENNKELFNDEKLNVSGMEFYIPNKQCLYLLKKSHLNWPIHWIKNMNDYTWMENYISFISEKEKIFYGLCEIKMNEIHGEKPFGNMDYFNKSNQEMYQLIKKINKPTFDEKLIKFTHKIVDKKTKEKIIKNYSFLKNYDYLDCKELFVSKNCSP
jgi:hypothetical protein